MTNASGSDFRFVLAPLLCAVLLLAPHVQASEKPGDYPYQVTILSASGGSVVTLRALMGLNIYVFQCVVRPNPIIPRCLEAIS